MPHSAQAKKRWMQSLDRNLRNRTAKSELKTLTKKVQMLTEGGKRSEAEACLKLAQSRIDKAAQKGIMHKNTAARRKALLARWVGAMK
ncbi:MAG: 30S ribosomal protein S20 [Planctomycetota bacterium]